MSKTQENCGKGFVRIQWLDLELVDVVPVGGMK